MRHPKRAAWLAILGLAMLVGAPACGGPTAEGYAGHGIVEDLDADARKVTLDHGDIPGFMKAMSMAYDLAPGVELEGIDPGATVDFRVKKDGGAYIVTEIRRSGS